ncbi:MAG TPA: DUF2089 domain-containing protein [Roseiflexaceae bacterium]|nr:DUF2089 domain-containing protein [Roseiflexaceae bacterium]
MYPLITKDPITGEPLLVTRLEGPSTGVVIEGTFSLGWVGRLTPEQMAFVGVLVRQRGNLQRAAAELGLSYNTARSRMDEVAEALEAPDEVVLPPPPETRARILEQLASGQISFDAAMRMLRGDAAE